MPGEPQHRADHCQRRGGAWPGYDPDDSAYIADDDLQWIRNPDRCPSSNARCCDGQDSILF